MSPPTNNWRLHNEISKWFPINVIQYFAWANNVLLSLFQTLKLKVTSKCLCCIFQLLLTIYKKHEYVLHLRLRTMSHAIYSAKFEQTTILQHVHWRRESQSHAPAHVLKRLYPIARFFYKTKEGPHVRIYIINSIIIDFR